MVRDAIAGLEAALPDGNSRTAAGHSNLGRMLVDQSRFGEALPHLELAVHQRAAAHGEDHLRTAESRLLLGRCLLALGRSDEAIPVLRRAHADLVGANGPDHARSHEAAAALESATRDTG